MKSPRQLLSGTARKLRRFLLALSGMQIDGRCWIQQVEIPRNRFDIHLEEGVALDRGVTILVSGESMGVIRVAIGKGSYINRHSMLDVSKRLTIGSDCMIGPFVYITDHDHGMAPESLIKDQSLIESSVTIGDDVWIGAHASILKGVTIGEGAVVAAGAVVTHSVDPYTIVGGVPAKVLGHRKEQTNG